MAKGTRPAKRGTWPRRAKGAAGAGLAVLAASAAAQTPPQLTLDYPAMADRIVRQMSLKPGEKVLLLAHPGKFEALVPHLRYAVMKAGGVDLGSRDVLAIPYPAEWDLEILERAWTPAHDALKSELALVDAAVMLPGALPMDPTYAALQNLLRGGKGRTVHFHWDGGGADSALPLPGQPLPPVAVIDALYQRALLTTDYEALGEVQKRFEAALRSGDVRVTTPAGTDLRFRVGNRPVNRQDGDASAARAARGVILIDREIELPAGAIRVAPLEESVEGTIAFPPCQWDQRPVDGLRLRFVKGRVTEIVAARGRDAVDAEMARAGAGGRAFREFALGFNPELKVPEKSPWIPYYGYGAGVVRLSLGDNSELGGTVGGGYVRWNFFTDATVTVGSDVWVKDGALTAPRR